jgi:UDP-N-acetylglucosamine 2-epimerase (non-hydrolysing)
MNPNVKRVVFEKLSKKKNIKLIDAQPYTHFSYLLSKCYFVLTDSGGIQEEAPSLKKPVLLMRNETERPEAIDAGVVKLVTSNREHIFENCSKLLLDRVAYEKMATQNNPYGDGMASNKICNILEKIYREQFNHTF